eukprot:c15328_g1_i1 orf=228-458(+)
MHRIDVEKDGIQASFILQRMYGMYDLLDADDDVGDRYSVDVDNIHLVFGDPQSPLQDEDITFVKLEEELDERPTIE